MNKDIVLVSVPKLDPSTPIAGPAVLKSQLERHGFSCVYMDMNVYLFNNMKDVAQELWWGDEHPCWLDIDLLTEEYGKKLKPYLFEFANNILEHDPKWVGITQFSTTSQAPSILLIDMLRLLGYDGKFVLGGPACMEFASDTPIVKKVDHIIYGEAEESLLQLLKGNEEFPGIDFKIFKQLENLDQYPFPDYSDLNLSEYEHGGSILYMVGSRGCVRNCSFCDIHAMAPKFKFRSGESLAEEVLHQSQKHPSVTIMRWADSLFNGAMREFHVFLDKIIEYKESGLLRKDMKFAGQCIVRPKKQCPPWYFEKMAKAGVLSQDLGIESGSDAVREHMKKKFDNTDLDHYVEMSHKYGIGITALMLVGYPTETEKDFQDTIDFFTRNEKYKSVFKHVIIGGTMILMPHSPIWHMAKDMGIVNDNAGNWILDDNTLDERIKRRKRLKDHVMELGYSIPKDNHEKVIKKYAKKSNKSYQEFWGYGAKGLELRPQKN